MKKTQPGLCEEEHYKRFYKSHLQSVSNFAFFKCGDDAMSFDLVQEAFIKIWENCKDIDPAKAKTYLFTTVNNLFLNTVRHKKVVLAYAEASPYTDRDNQDPEYLMREEEFKQQLLKAIEDLTESQRDIFLMNRVEGKKYREIAETLDISQKTVEKHMSAALKSLRTKFKSI